QKRLVVQGALENSQTDVALDIVRHQLMEMQVAHDELQHEHKDLQQTLGRERAQANEAVAAAASMKSTLLGERKRAELEEGRVSSMLKERQQLRGQVDELERQLKETQGVIRILDQGLPALRWPRRWIKGCLLCASLAVGSRAACFALAAPLDQVLPTALASPLIKGCCLSWPRRSLTMGCLLWRRKPRRSDVVMGRRSRDRAALPQMGCAWCATTSRAENEAGAPSGGGRPCARKRMTSRSSAHPAPAATPAGSLPPRIFSRRPELMCTCSCHLIRPFPANEPMDKMLLRSEMSEGMNRLQQDNIREKERVAAAERIGEARLAQLLKIQDEMGAVMQERTFAVSAERLVTEKLKQAEIKADRLSAELEKEMSDRAVTDYDKQKFIKRARTAEERLGEVMEASAQMEKEVVELREENRAMMASVTSLQSRSAAGEQDVQQYAPGSSNLLPSSP
ncbi:hypothetical protein CYMTET_46337, partial [Cymbomonas tetramitiformis]